MKKNIAPFSFWINPNKLRKFIIINLWDGDEDDDKNWVVLKEIMPGAPYIIHHSMTDFRQLIAEEKMKEW